MPTAEEEAKHVNQSETKRESETQDTSVNQEAERGNTETHQHDQGSSSPDNNPASERFDELKSQDEEKSENEGTAEEHDTGRDESTGNDERAGAEVTVTASVLEQTSDRQNDVTQSRGPPEGSTNVTDNETYEKLIFNLIKSTESLQREHDQIKASHIKDLDVLNLQDKIRIANEAQSDATVTLRSIADHSGRLQESACAIHKLIDRKLADEGLVSWVARPTAPEGDPDLVAEEKELLAQAAEKRAAIAVTNKTIAELQERIQQLQLEATEAAAAATEARKSAERARRLAEEARRAAEEKARAEEEARRKAEEERKRKEEEERKKKEEEERRRRELQRKGLTPEEQERRREEAARRDPANWPSWVYSVEPGDLEIPVGCVVRAIPGSLSRDQVQVDVVNQADGTFTLNDHEELVSHIIRLGYTDPEADHQLEEPLSVALPHCAPRNIPTRQVSVKQLTSSGKWMEIPTNDVVFDDMREYKFVEVRLKSPCSLAVVFRFKQENHVIGKRGGKIFPTVDPRICLTVPPKLLQGNVQIVTEIHPIELSTVSDVRARRPEDRDILMACSPIVNLTLPFRKLAKPLMVALPVPPNPSRVKRERPSTASASDRGGKSSLGNRPKSAFAFMATKKEDDDDDQLTLVTVDQDGNWTALTDLSLSQAKNKDIVTFEMTEPLKKFAILRTKTDTPAARLEKLMMALEVAIKQRPVQIIVRQNASEPKDVVIICTNAYRTDRFLRRLADDGYTEGPNPSLEMIMNEGTVLTVCFRGNVDKNEEGTLHLVYNTHIKARLDITVEEIDRFAQKSIHCFRGFAQFFTRGMVKKLVPRDEEAAKQKNPPMKTILVEGDVLLTELLICLPKPDPEPPKPIQRAPVTFRSDGLVDEALFRQLASDLGDEWRRLANQLNVRRMRIQAIMRNHVNQNNNENAIFDMLMTWAKKVPRSLNKADILCSALLVCGRSDLAEQIRDRESDIRKQRATSARDSQMKRVIIQVSQEKDAAIRWRDLGVKLGLSGPAMDDIEMEGSSDRERCQQVLTKWKTIANNDVNKDELVKHLRRIKLHTAADLAQRV